MVYSAGLFDYLDAAVARRLVECLYELTAPGGRLVIGNFASANPFTWFIEFAADWHLVYRSREDLLALVPESAVDAARWVDAEPNGVNLFLVIDKPQAQAAMLPTTM